MDHLIRRSRPLAVPLLASTLSVSCASASALSASSEVNSSRADARATDASRGDATGASRTDARAEASYADAADGGPIDVTRAYPAVCNGHAELCGRSYDRVAFAGTHGSYAVSSQGFLAPDQTYSVARQLQDGIRVLHFELHIYESAVYACHSICAIGSLPFADEMTSIASFVAANPTEVVTMLLERSDSTITADNIGDVIKASGLEPRMAVQQVGAAWPTLGDMTQGGQTVVALLDDRELEELAPAALATDLGDAVGQHDTDGLRSVRGGPRRDGRRRLRR